MDKKNIKISDFLDIAPMQSMSDKIFSELSKLIQNGTLPEGYTFPNESVLCEQLHVGRTSLREAYKALELSGYVTRTKRGTVVNGKSAIIGATPLKVSMEQSSEKDFVEFRTMLEAEAARLAALRATEEDLAEMEDLLNQIAEVRKEDRYEDMMYLDRDFHKALAAGSKNSLIMDTMLAMAEVWNRETKINFFKAAVSQPEILDEMTLQHKKLMLALRKKDPELAASVMIDHIRYVSHK